MSSADRSQHESAEPPAAGPVRAAPCHPKEEESSFTCAHNPRVSKVLGQDGSKAHQSLFIACNEEGEGVTQQHNGQPCGQLSRGHRTGPRIHSCCSYLCSFVVYLAIKTNRWENTGLQHSLPPQRSESKAVTPRKIKPCYSDGKRERLNAEEAKQHNQHPVSMQRSHIQTAGPKEICYCLIILLPEQQVQLSLNGCEHFNYVLLAGTAGLPAFAGSGKHRTILLRTTGVP